VADRRVPEATELVYVPQPSWLPLFTAVGLTAIVLGLFAGWVLALVGAIVFLAAVARWIRRTADEVSRMPREQHPATAVLPAVPPARR
jgi:hypothetical protein